MYYQCPRRYRRLSAFRPYEHALSGSASLLLPGVLIFGEVLEQVNPDVVLTSSKADDEFLDFLREHSEDRFTSRASQ
jgi:hypothetical protein